MSDIGESMIRGLTDALNFANGEENNCVVHIPEEINVRRIRNKMQMTQDIFANTFGFSVRTLQDWEQGRRVPTGVSRNFLYIIDREPELVRNVLMQPLPPQDQPNAP